VGVAVYLWGIELPLIPSAGDHHRPPQANQCTSAGPDGNNDLNLKFDAKEVISALGTITNKEVRVLTLTGELNDGTLIEGQDVVVINKKK